MYPCDELFYKMPQSAPGRAKSEDEGRAMAYNDLSSTTFVLDVSAANFPSSVYGLSVRSKQDLICTMAKVTANAPMAQGRLTKENQKC